MIDTHLENNRSHGKRPTVLGVPFDDVSVEQAIRQIVWWVEHEPHRTHQVVTANPEFLVAARRNQPFRDVLLTADLTTPDGIGVLIGSRILGRPIRNRVTGVDLVEGLASHSDSDLRLFLLGAAPGIAERAAERLRARFPSIQIAGVWEGSPEPEDSPEIIDRLRAAHPTILLVAYGAPKQDIWISDRRKPLGECGIVVAIGIGGALDYLAGAVPRAPKWMRRFGFEWLFRLIRQPWRWRRQLALPLFVLLVIGERLRLSRPNTRDRVW
jgi:N-acetylglucosaminyldiphosphoundecaprenol N-acetyl-beta-D-mannosaminyltransferase